MTSQSLRMDAAQTAIACGSEAMPSPGDSQANPAVRIPTIFTALRARLELAFMAQRHELRGDVELAARCRQLMRDPELVGVVS